MKGWKRHAAGAAGGALRADGLEGRVVAVAMSSTIVAMLAAFGIYQWSNWTADRQELAADTVAFGLRVSSAARQATLENDEAAARDAAALLLGAEHVLEASYFTDDGRRYDIGGGDGRLARLQPSGAQAVQVAFRTPGVEVRVPHLVAGRRVGEVALRASDSEVTGERIRNILMALALSLAGTLAAGLMARRLARRALRPLNGLNAAVETLAASRDFTARVPVVSHDEVGRLTCNYNRLLDALQGYDLELRQALADVTQARDAAEEANRLKSQFLANMGHEIRTPLNGVMGMAQALMLEKLSSRQKQRVEVIRSSGAALLCILNDVLDLSQIESGKLPLDNAPFDIETVAREACEVATTLAESKGLAFSLVVEGPAAGAWQGDGGRVGQVLYNLVSNALKFTAKGAVAVKVACDAGAGGLVISVSDTGIGISPDLAPRLFGKFEQGEADATRRFGGTGVGLAICRSLVELMAGEIEVESAEGYGSTFRVRLPLRRAESDEAAEAGDIGALRVLVAEDNETNQQVVRTVLNALGVEPVIVADGQAAVDAWSHGRFDLVLMDIQMPVRDGVAATRDIRQLEAELGLERTRIVALTANAMPHQAEEYAAAGMDGLVPKPIMLDKLHAALVGSAPALRAA